MYFTNISVYESVQHSSGLFLEGISSWQTRLIVNLMNIVDRTLYFLLQILVHLKRYSYF